MMQFGRQCRQCKRVYPPELIADFFTTQRVKVAVAGLRVNRLTQARLGPLQLETICNTCLQKRRDARKRENRLLDKARDTRRRHAARFSQRLGREVTPSELEHDALWILSDMVHDMEHELKNGCHYCREPYSAMGHGHSDITLDIKDPDKSGLPVYGHDTEWCCSTCNTKKRGKSQSEWAAICASFRRQRDFLAVLEASPAPLIQLQFDLEDSEEAAG